MNLASLESVARAFWSASGLAKAYPRDIERAIAYALPLAVIRLPQLTVDGVFRWLAARRMAAPSRHIGRSLRGCLYAHGGQGVVFVDGSDSSDEIRIVLAHEVAHFILHHLAPRRRAVSVLGVTSLEILDGHRRPTTSEQLAGVLRGIKMTEYIHAIERERDGGISSGHVALMEAEADLLAFELVAPLKEVRRRVVGVGVDRHLIADVIEEQFGIPRPTAESWATHIASLQHRATSFADWLRAEKQT